MSARARCALVALLGVLAVFAWTTAKVHYTCDGNWTAVFCTGANLPIPPDLRETTYLFPGDGYDGQFYRYLAHDLFQQKGYFRYIDSPRYRGRRVLISALAWVLAFGQARWVDTSYIVVEMFFFGLGVYWTARILQSRGRSPYWGLLFLVVPGTLATIDRMLLDGPMTAIFAGFIWYLEQRRWGIVWLLCAAALLTRDTGLFLPVAVALDRLLHRDWRRAVWFCCTVIPVLAWSYFLSLRVPPETPTALTKLLDIPVWGLIERMFALRDDRKAFYQLVLRVTDILSVLGLGASVVLASDKPHGARTPGTSLLVA